MEQNNQNRRPSRKMGLGGILIRAALILLCLIMLSVYLMDGLYARYRSTGSGDDSARVAKFDVDVAFENGDAIVDSISASMEYDDTTGSYTIVVENDSEVAICYDIYIENIVLKVGGEEKTLAGVTVKLDDKTPTEVNADQRLFADAGTMEPNAATNKEHTLSFFVNWDAFLAQFTGESVSAAITFNVRVDVEQID